MFFGGQEAFMGNFGGNSFSTYLLLREQSENYMLLQLEKMPYTVQIAMKMPPLKVRFIFLEEKCFSFFK